MPCLRPRTAAGHARGLDLLVRMHLLHRMHRETLRRGMPQLRRQSRAPPDAGSEMAGEPSAELGAKGAGLTPTARSEPIRPPFVPSEVEGRWHRLIAGALRLRSGRTSLGCRA